MSSLINNDMNETAKKKKKTDLKTRERVNFIVDSQIMNRLRKLSEETHTPMSRMIDTALETTYSLNNKSIFNSVIPIQHSVKIYIFEKNEDDSVLSFKNILLENDKQYIEADCMLIKEKQRKIGTVIDFYLDDKEEPLFNTCISKLKDLNLIYSIVLDGKTMD